LLQLLLYRDGRYGLVLTVPADLAARLRAFVSPPAPAGLSTLGEWPADERAWRRDTERDALSEVGIVLRLIDLGKLAVSEKTALPGTACLRELAAALSAGDFYPQEVQTSKSTDEIGPIKAYAWPLLIQAGGLAELHGKKLALTKAGRAALGKPGAEVLRTLWKRWIANKKFDEFNRIDVIRGQTGKGKRSMTAAAGRRGIIAEGLSECPVGAWIRLADFSRYLRAAGFRFEITRDPWDLYIHDPHYGSLGYDGFHGWNILQERYLTALLFEYAATLGVIDVAYVEPWNEPQDFGDIWGTDDLRFLSRYDGLRGFRLTPLGAYCLGLVDDYQPTAPDVRIVLNVLPSLAIEAKGELSTEEKLFLDGWAEREDEGLWRLERRKLVAAVESGRPVAELRSFLSVREAQDLPETVEGLLLSAERDGAALRNSGAVLLIECRDAELAEIIVNDPVTKNLCQRAGPKHLLVKIEAEERFRKAANGLGYGMPKN